MTDQSPPPKSERLARAAERAAELHTLGSDGVHPMSRILFGWVGWKHIGALFFWGLAALGLMLVGIDTVMNRHDYFHIANATGFYALWGFGSFAFVVLMGWPLGKLLRRGENYYGDAGGPPADIDPALSLPVFDYDIAPDGEDD